MLPEGSQPSHKAPGESPDDVTGQTWLTSFEAQSVWYYEREKSISGWFITNHIVQQRTGKRFDEVCYFRAVVRVQSIRHHNLSGDTIWWVRHVQVVEYCLWWDTVHLLREDVCSEQNELTCVQVTDLSNPSKIGATLITFHRGRSRIWLRGGPTLVSPNLLT